MSVENRIPPNFLDLPITIANRVLEKLESMDLLVSRKVCRSLRTAVDRSELHFDEILFCILDNTFSTDPSQHYVTMTLNGFKIKYTASAAAGENSDTTVTFNGQNRTINGENYRQIAFQDLETVLKHASRLRLCLVGARRMVTSFINALKAKKCVHVKNLELVYCSATEILGILPWLDAQVLEQIQLSDTEISNQLERFNELEQWKNAKIFKLSDSLLSSNRIEYLFHFEQFSIKISDFPIEIAVKIRDDLLTRSTFQKCDITFKGSKSDPVELAGVFKYAGDKEFLIKFRNYSNVHQEWGLFIERLKNCKA